MKLKYDLAEDYKEIDADCDFKHTILQLKKDRFTIRSSLDIKYNDKIVYYQDEIGGSIKHNAAKYTELYAFDQPLLPREYAEMINVNSMYELIKILDGEFINKLYEISRLMERIYSTIFSPFNYDFSGYSRLCKDIPVFTIEDYNNIKPHIGLLDICSQYKFLYLILNPDLTCHIKVFRFLRIPGIEKLIDLTKIKDDLFFYEDILHYTHNQISVLIEQCFNSFRPKSKSARFLLR